VVGVVVEEWEDLGSRGGALMSAVVEISDGQKL
jgi:hypothetical protein